MYRKLDLQTRRLLAHYRAQPIGTALRVIARKTNASGGTLVMLRVTRPVVLAA